KFDAALKDADELLSTAGNNTKLNLPALRLIKALSLLSTAGKETEALGALKELIDKGPADAPEVRTGRARRAQILYNNKAYADARADFLILSDPAKAASPEEAAE